MDIQTWIEQEYQPWRDAMAGRLEERSKVAKIIKGNLPVVKHILAMIYEGKSIEAVGAWNSLGLEPKVKNLTLSADQDWLEIETPQGQKTMVSFDQLLQVLEEIMQA